MTSPAFTLDSSTIQQLVEKAVEDNILSVVDTLTQDPVWLEKIERMINQAVVQRTLAGLTSVDVTSVIQQHVDNIMPKIEKNISDSLKYKGIDDRASGTQLTVMDETVVVENEFVSKDIKVVKTAVIQDLVVRGSINTDNRSWEELKSTIAQKTLDQISQEWTQKLVDQVRQQIKDNGIDFENVTVNGEPLLKDQKLSSAITESNLQSVGQLRELRVGGELHAGSTFSVLNRRVGINTTEPEMALTLWDNEVVINIGKHKTNQAYIGTSRNQSLALGVNRVPQLEIDNDGLTSIKKLRVGLHKIMFDIQVPGWSGTRGDIVFNSNPGSDRVFAWVCLGSHKWETLRASQ